MLVGKNPWVEPTIQDEMFLEFTGSSVGFLEQFTSDKDTLCILSGCLEIDASKRWDITQLCESIDDLVNGPPDSAIDMPNSIEMILFPFRLLGGRSDSWESEAMDFTDVPVFPDAALEKEDELNKTLVFHDDEEVKVKKRKRRHRKHKGKHVHDKDGMIEKFAAVFSKILTPTPSLSGLLGSMTFL